jgi:predicted Zn-dependent protease with MMP-like domain
MFGNFLMKTMLQRQLKGMPKEMQDAVISAFEKNPQFFKDMMNEIVTKVKSGVPQATAVQQVMMSKRAELQKMLTGQ